MHCCAKKASRPSLITPYKLTLALSLTFHFSFNSSSTSFRCTATTLICRPGHHRLAVILIWWHYMVVCHRTVLVHHCPILITNCITHTVIYRRKYRVRRRNCPVHVRLIDQNVNKPMPTDQIRSNDVACFFIMGSWHKLFVSQVGTFKKRPHANKLSEEHTCTHEYTLKHRHTHKLWDHQILRIDDTN